jgi:hypothetical protein
LPFSQAIPLIVKAGTIGIARLVIALLPPKVRLFAKFWFCDSRFEAFRHSLAVSEKQVDGIQADNTYCAE